MNDDDDGIVRKTRRLEPIGLDSLNIADLNAYIDELTGEIARVKTAISAKQGARTAADRFFRTPDA